MVPGECPNESGCEVFRKRVSGRNKTLICSNLTIGMQCQFLVSLWFVLWLHNKQLHKRSCLVFAQASKQAWGALRTTQFSQFLTVSIHCATVGCRLGTNLSVLHGTTLSATRLVAQTCQQFNKQIIELSLLVSAKWIYDTIYSVHVLCK